LSAVARRYYVRATAALRRGDTETARDDLRAALDLAPSFVAARVAYASLLGRTGDPHRAAQVLREALASELRPTARLAIERTLGDVLIATGDYRGAEACFTAAAAASASIGEADAALADRLARLRAKTGRFGEALEQLLVAARARR
jgi:Tfp pilus assembly protein PilF